RTRIYRLLTLFHAGLNTGLTWSVSSRACLHQPQIRIMKISMFDSRASALSRRHFLRGFGLAAGAMLFHTTRGLFAEELIATPQLTEGPFYPDKLPLDTDNDLIIVNDSVTPAVGEITHLTGRVLSATGAPVRNAVVEIWQVDHN